MKTTLEIPDEVYRQIKALAALEGRSVRDLVNTLLRKRLEDRRAADEERGWRSVFGKAPAGDVARVQASIDEEFSRVDLDEW
ncbi:MAG: hypothetical protein GXP55_23890 [Deltaproteobacteria bacterium]|nr:hypothetical protein [Deltaproteobacteria bacterium]